MFLVGNMGVKINSDLVRINYIDKDHDSIVSDVIAQIKAKYPDTWTDFEHDNAGRMLLEVHLI